MKKENRLPEEWCVKNDGSQRFKDTVVKWLNENYDVKHTGSYDGYYYGSKYFSEGPNDTILTIDQFVELTTRTKEELIAMYEAKIAELNKPVYEVGRWYINQHGMMCKYVAPRKHCGVGVDNIWFTDLNWLETNATTWTPATDDQIKSKLEKCAVKMGYTVANFKCLSGTQVKSYNDEVCYFGDSDTLYMGRNRCYCNGQWATIIKEEPLVINEGDLEEKVEDLNIKLSAYKESNDVLNEKCKLLQLENDNLKGSYDSLRHSLRLTKDESILQAVENIINQNESLRKGKEAWQSFDEKYVRKGRKMDFFEQAKEAGFGGDIESEIREGKGEDKIFMQKIEEDFKAQLSEREKLLERAYGLSRKDNESSVMGGIFPVMQKIGEKQEAVELIKKGIEILENHLKPSPKVEYALKKLSKTIFGDLDKDILNENGL